MRISWLLLILPLALLAGGCSTAGAERPPALVPDTAILTAEPTAAQPADTESAQAAEMPDKPEPIETPSQMETPLVEPTVPPGAVPSQSAAASQQASTDWRELPVIPEISPRVKEIYARGQEMGNRPGAFSKIGDCGSTPAWFLGDFDAGPRYYSLGEHKNLEAVIAAFQGSYSRTSLAAKSGFNASSIFSPLWANREACQPNETPLACEYRLQRPVVAFIMLGTNDVYHPDEFEPQMRKIIEYSIDQGVIPILSTKADNLEGDGSINAVIARLAQEYSVPLLNYWRALQELPDQGLQEDRAHITWGPNRFDDPAVMARGWPVRNLTALQALDAVWQAVQ